MCTEAVVLKGSQRIHCETVGELAKALNVNTAMVSDDGFDFCLCNAKWDQLGARRTFTDPFIGYEIEVVP